MLVFFYTKLNIPISEDGPNLSHMHNLVKSQSYWGLKLLVSNTKFTNTINSMLIHREDQETLCEVVISACHVLVME